VTNPYELAQLAADELRERSGVDAYGVAVVLGSGWKEGALALGTPSNVVPTSSLSGFVAPTVVGHSGEILSLKVAGRDVALVSGRVHLYEGNSAHQVVHSVRTVIAAGARLVVLTNACGGLDREKLRDETLPLSLVVCIYTKATVPTKSSTPCAP